MLSIRSSIKASFITISALFMTLGLPAASFTSVSAEECTPPPSNQAGVHWPTGSEAPTYTYQCEGQYSGKWTNAYYVYDPTTSTRAPLYAPDYRYDCTNNSWSKVQYDYSPARSIYYASRVASSDPGLPTGCPIPDSPSPADPASSSNGLTGSSNNGAGSSNNANGSLNNNYSGTNSTSLAINNNLTTVSSSGNSTVLGNLVAGSANTGNSTSIANIVNMLQSSSNSLGSGNNTIIFSTDIDGDVNGDLMLDPAMLSQVQPATSSTSNNDINNKLTINNSTDASINNDITVKANSGDATVSKNNEAGHATTGNAKAVTDIVNIVNSAISSGQSFIGVVNINGNLNGDILLPPNFVDQLLAANVPTITISGPTSNNVDDTSVINTSSATNTNNQSITNNVNASATSGNATVSKNNSGGNATTGNASANITAFNLTGSNVVGSNALLVFVNVLGNWVGLIVNAPTGTSAASLGGGITQNNANISNESTVNNTSNHTINNNINTVAQSGDATVEKNLKSGDAKSGDAYSAVNLWNVENSTMSLSGWLGILFINVFGSWNGSFGMNTSAGDPITNAVANAQSGGSSTPQVFRFVPTSARGSDNSSYDVKPYSSSGGATSDGQADTKIANALLTNAHIKSNTAPTPQLQEQKQSSLNKTSLLIVGAVALYIFADAAYTRRHPERS